MALRLLACTIIPLVLLGLVLTRPAVLMALPSLVLDLVIGVVIILPIVAIKVWKSRKA